jgi:uncharacterized protein (TIGR00369 family)
MIWSPTFRQRSQASAGGEHAPALAMAKLSAKEINEFLAQVFPQIDIGKAYTVEETAHAYARVRMSFGDHLLRPGGTISGPAMFALADVAMYAAVLASLGPAAHAVTVNLNITFLRRPGQRDMIGEARLLKVGKRLAMGEVALHSDGEEELAAHATSTYSLPE